MTLPSLCIKRPVMTTSLTLAIVLVGLIGYFFLPVAALPKVDFPTVSVTTSLPGASPSTMAASIASPLEREFAAIAGVDSAGVGAGFYLRLAEIRGAGSGRSRPACCARHRARRGAEGARGGELEYAGRVAQRTAAGLDFAG